MTVTNPDTSPFHSIDLAAAWAREPPQLDFVLPGLARGTIGNLVAAGGAGKTFLMLATALAVGIGRDLCGIWGEVPRRGTVAFLSLEDPDTELARRVWMLRDLLSEEERGAARGAVHILPMAGRGVAMADPLKEGGIRTTPWFANFSRQIVDLAPRLLVIDTLNRLLGSVSENDGGAMGAILAELEILARRADCAIVLCHHVSKGALSSGTAGEAHAARGSSVITNNARWQVNLSIVPKEGPFATLDDAERRRHVRLEFTKLNYDKPQPGRRLVRGEGGILRYQGPDVPLGGRGRRGARKTSRNDHSLGVPRAE